MGVGLFGNGLVMLFCRALIQSSAVKLDLLLDICWILQKDIVLMLRKFLQVFIMGTGHEFEAGRPHLLPAPIINGIQILGSGLESGDAPHPTSSRLGAPTCYPLQL